MPKRIGFLWEKMITEENCIQAELNMCRHKKHNRRAKIIRQNPERYAKRISADLQSGTYHFHKPREKDIKDSYKGKVRHLKIPCLYDQALMQAWLNVATPHIEKRNYFYNCGSIPKAGQIRAVRKIQKMLKSGRPPTYAVTTDIRKFYDTCPHEVVIRGLRRIFKDERFIAFAQEIMDSMSEDGIGLAIGYPVSHWFANIALMELDHSLRRRFRDVTHVRYMDDVIMIGRNKRHLWKAFRYYEAEVHGLGMTIKSNWQLFPIRARAIEFLSYRFFKGYTLLTKRLMYRISRRAKKLARLTLHNAQAAMAYFGVLKHCNSYNFYKVRVEPYLKKSICRRVISHERTRIQRIVA